MAKYIVEDVTVPFKIDKEQNSISVEIYKNYWWACVDGDPKKAVFYSWSSKYRTPQCNLNKSIMDHVYVSGSAVDRIGKALEKKVEIVQIPMAYFKREL